MHTIKNPPQTQEGDGVGSLIQLHKSTMVTERSASVAALKNVVDASLLACD